MKKLLSIFVLVAMITSSAYAADPTPAATPTPVVKKKKKKAVKTVKTATTTTTTKSTSNDDSIVMTSSRKGPELSASFGLGTAGSKFHMGFGFQVEFPTTMDNNHFRFGGQTGFYYGPSSPSSFIIPILVTGTYDFKSGSDGFMPYLALGMGISIFHASVTVLGTTVSDSSTDFAILFKPGANFGENKKYFVEMPIGTMGNAFCLLPSVGEHF